MRQHLDDLGTSSIAGKLNLTGNDVRRAVGFGMATLGTDVDYTCGGWFEILEWAVYSNLIGFRERLALVEYFMRKREPRTP